MFGIDLTLVYTILGTVSITSVVVGLLIWRHMIKVQVAEDFNNQQLKQTVKDQEKLITSMKSINDLQLKTIDDLNAQNNDLNTKLSSVEAYINSDAAKKADRASSSVLKEVIKQLGNQQ